MIWILLAVVGLLVLCRLNPSPNPDPGPDPNVMVTVPPDPLPGRSYTKDRAGLEKYIFEHQRFLTHYQIYDPVTGELLISARNPLQAFDNGFLIKPGYDGTNMQWLKVS